MNKVKLILLSSQILDETAIIDVFYNDKKIIENYVVPTEKTDLIFDVENTDNLYNKINIISENFIPFVERTDYSSQGTPEDIFILNSDLSDLDEIVLLLFSIEISNDNGETWINVSPHSEKNPQTIQFMNDDYIYARKTSNFVNNVVKVFDEQKNVVFANPLDINIWIPSVDRANNISTVILDNVNYEEFTLNSIFYRTIRKEYVYAVHVNGNEDFTDVEKFGKSDKYNRKLNKFEN